MKKKVLKFIGVFAACLIFAAVWNVVPATAAVTDNLQSAVEVLLGKKQDSVSGDDYTNASTNAKLNYLQNKVNSLQADFNSIKSNLGLN